MSIKKYEEDYLLMTEAGFIAVNQADEDAATKLFNAADLLNPKSTLATVGKGYLHLHKLELDDAVKMFDKVLKEEPHNEMAKAFKGLALSLNPKDIEKGEKILEESAKTSDSGIKKLADSAIAFVEKFVKTTPGPAEKKKK